MIGSYGLTEWAVTSLIKDLFTRFWNMTCVWDPKGVVLQEKLKKKVQNWAARFVISNYYFKTESIAGILKNIEIGVFKENEDSRLILLYKGLKSAAIQQMTLSLKPLKLEMPFQIRLLPPLKVRMIG